MNRGDIHFVMLPVPPPKPQPGSPPPPAQHVQFGPRRAVIVQHSNSTANLTTVLIVPITKNQKRAFQHSFFISPSTGNGLDLPSTVLTHQLRVVDKNDVQKRLGRLDPKDLQQLENELRAILNL